jgi:hypothetical protein
MFTAATDEQSPFRKPQNMAHPPNRHKLGAGRWELFTNTRSLLDSIVGLSMTVDLGHVEQPKPFEEMMLSTINVTQATTSIPWIIPSTT